MCLSTSITVHKIMKYMHNKSLKIHIVNTYCIPIFIDNTVYKIYCKRKPFVRFLYNMLGFSSVPIHLHLQQDSLVVQNQAEILSSSSSSVNFLLFSRFKRDFPKIWTELELIQFLRINCTPLIIMLSKIRKKMFCTNKSGSEIN